MVTKPEHNIWEPLKIHFDGQVNLFDSGRCQAKATLASTKADLLSLPEYKNLLLTAQKQLLELPISFMFAFSQQKSSETNHGYCRRLRNRLIVRYWKIAVHRYWKIFTHITIRHRKISII